MASRGVTTVPIFYIDTDGTMYDTTTDELLYGNNNKYDAEESRLRLAHVLRNRKQQQQQQQQQQQPLLSTTTTTTAPTKCGCCSEKEILPQNHLQSGWWWWEYNKSQSWCY